MYKLSATNYDLVFLDQTCSFCWFIAGSTLIRFLKVALDARSEPEVTRLSDEVSSIRYGLLNDAPTQTNAKPSKRQMLCKLGERTVIGSESL